MWETGDDRAKLEGSQGCCSNLVPSIYLVGGCTRRIQKPAVTVFSVEYPGDLLDEKSAMKIAKKFD